MERLTIADENLPNGCVRRTVIDGNKLREYCFDFYWALKRYEDTGFGPEAFERLQFGAETPFEIAAEQKICALEAENVRLAVSLATVTRERNAAVNHLHRIDYQLQKFQEEARYRNRQYSHGIRDARKIVTAMLDLCAYDAPEKGIENA
ncbi:MAG: hypothetical protein LLF96_03095 [Eubacteriales bacterium]|nr:hypothetical protein [Eubacteriales bacterium]